MGRAGSVCRCTRTRYALGSMAVLYVMLALSSAQARESGIQGTPDGKRSLVNKDVGDSRFVITQDRDDLSATGNVFFTDDRPPTFLYCASRGGAAFSCSGAATCASSGRASGIQRRPDGKGILVSKTVDDARFAITQNSDDGTLTGNVFFTDGRSPEFLSCQPQGGSTYSCSGSDRCGNSSCPPFTFVADVTLPSDFFTVPSECPDFSFISDVTLPDDFFALTTSSSAESAEIFGSLVKVQSGLGTEARLTRGAAPLPQTSAPSTISGVEARFDGFSAAHLVVPFGTGAAAISALRETEGSSDTSDDALIVAVARPDGSLMEGFYELPLSSTSETALLDLTFATTSVVPLVRLATRLHGIISAYERSLVSFTFSSDTPLLGFQVSAHYPLETGAFVGAADSVSCRIPALGIGIFHDDQDFCRAEDRAAFLANNRIESGELILQVVSCAPNPGNEHRFLPSPIMIVCGFAAAPGRTLAPLDDIEVDVSEVVVADPQSGSAIPGSPDDLGVTAGLVVRQ